MRSIRHRNVNRAYAHAMQILTTEGYESGTRNGPALVHPMPFSTTYARPWERVLFSEARKANPFFHLFESFWMLAGWSDAAFLNQYIRDFGDRFAEEDGHLWGAYGRRWRQWFPMANHLDPVLYADQIEQCIDKLLCDPGDRRVVLAMWDPQSDLVANKRDIPCNTHIYLRLVPTPYDPVHQHQLITTVCCRSNDAVWGAYGANAVHFSVLHEYMAWRLDCAMGPMVQVSNNMHVYQSSIYQWNPKEDDTDRYSREEVAWSSLFAGCEPTTFHEELRLWLEDPAAMSTKGIILPVFRDLMIPMARVHKMHKAHEYRNADDHCRHILHTDWQAAARMWLDQHRRDR